MASSHPESAAVLSSFWACASVKEKPNTPPSKDNTQVLPGIQSFQPGWGGGISNHWCPNAIPCLSRYGMTPPALSHSRHQCTQRTLAAAAFSTEDQYLPISLKFCKGISHKEMAPVCDLHFVTSQLSRTVCWAEQPGQWGSQGWHHHHRVLWHLVTCG